MFRIALAQINSTVGDLTGNQAKIADGIARAREAGADLVAFPELAVTGYPPEDLLLKPSFVAANLEAVERIAGMTRGITAVVGFVDKDTDLHNAAAVLHDGELAAVYHKIYLPNYGVFDEDRYFAGGDVPLILDLGEVTAWRQYLRGYLASVRSPRAPGAGRGAAGDQYLGVTLSRRKRGGPRADAGHPGRRQCDFCRPSATWSAARTSWSSTAGALFSTSGAIWLPAGGSSTKTWSSPTWTCRRCFANVSTIPAAARNRRASLRRRWSGCP